VVHMVHNGTFQQSASCFVRAGTVKAVWRLALTVPPTQGRGRMFDSTVQFRMQLLQPCARARCYNSCMVDGVVYKPMSFKKRTTNAQGILKH